MIYLTKEQIILLHSSIIRKTGGTAGLRDESLLESAISAPLQTFEGTDMFLTDLQKIIRLSYGLIANHAFVDGNKRIGAHVLLILLSANKISMEYSQQELIDCVLAIASGSLSYDEFCNWVIKHIKSS